MILVTGGTGLIGSHLIYRLLSKGNKLRVLIRTEESKSKIEKVFKYYGEEKSVNKADIEWCVGDILDSFSLKEAFEGVDKVFHCAGYVSFNEKEKQKIFDVNIRGTENVVNQCLLSQVEKMVHVSSVSAIASGVDKENIKEANGWPSSYKSAYSYSKTRAEFAVWRGIEEGLNAVIVNPTVVLGPGNWESGSSMLFSQIYSGMRFYTNGTTGVVDVRDVADAMVALMESDSRSERFILNTANVGYKHLLQSIGKEFGLKTPDLKASRFLTEIAWRIEALRSRVLFSTPKVTRVTARTSHEVSKYSSEKLLQTIKFNYRDLEGTIKFTCAGLIFDKRDKKGV